MLIPIDGLLDKHEVAQFRRPLGTAEWVAGLATAGALARSAKQNQQLADNAEPAISLGRHLLQRLDGHPLFVSAALPSKIYPPKFNRYVDAGHYDTHVDSALMRIPGSDTMMRTDLAATVFLSEPDDYDGGELEIEGAFGVQSVKLDAGDMVLYSASSLHRVTPVTRGARLAAFFWIESVVADDTERLLLFDLDQAIQGITPNVPPSDPHLLKLTAVYHNLLRRWAKL